MLSPQIRRIAFILLVVVTLWFLSSLSDRLETPFPEANLLKSAERSPRPPRPNYLPFNPPGLKGNGPTNVPQDSNWAARTESVRQAFLHAYRAYEYHAPFPNDELLPLSNKSVTNFNGWGLTLVDSMDTMYLLGLKEDFNRAVSKVEQLKFSMAKDKHAQFFETVIRYLGGLLSAYAISHEPILLKRAEELGTKLLPVFNTTSGLPMYAVNPDTKETKGTGTMLFAEIASCQLEYKYLAFLTGREEFFTTVERVMDHMKVSQPAHGMWPTVFDTKTGTPTNAHHSVGAWADSAYEYVLKQYLMSGKTEHRLAIIYMKAVRGVLENLVFVSKTRNLMYITDTHGLLPTRKFEHLSCFFPGLLALGATTLPEGVMSPEEKELHMWAAEGLAHTCWIMYADQPSGLGAEIVIFDEDLHGEDAKQKWIFHLKKWEEQGRPGLPPGVGNAGPPLRFGGDKPMDYSIWTSSYLLRPETLESMFILYRTTRDDKWRNRGWQIWEAIESKTHTWSGYACVTGVDTDIPVRKDSMPSYFLAETIKYAYLLTIEKDPWPADQWIFNTEAHPFPVFKWDEWQRQRLGVDDGPV